jgi:hypothetical protein
MSARAILGAVLRIACAPAAPHYQHSRYGYWAFRARVGALNEPNYLPWLMHRETLFDGQEALVACRWPDDAFPLRYHVAQPTIPNEVQDEFHPRDPMEYVTAVARAFKQWEKTLDRPLRFQLVDDPEKATLQIHLDVEMRHEREGQVLGMVRNEADRCRVVGPGPDDDHVEIVYAVRHAYLYISDSFGLLTPRQVQSVALHEIGHVLGASGQHSPLRGDAMYKIADDRRVETLSEHDRNSLRALYRVRPGAIYARLNERHGEPLSEVRRTPPRLASEILDDRFGFKVRFPVGWQVIHSPRGWISVDGLSWDYDASIQLIALRGSLGDYMEARRRTTFGPETLVSSDMLEIDGQPVGRIVTRAPERTEEFSVQDWRKGWVLAMVADCSSADYMLYQPWFRRVLLSLEHYEPQTASGSGPPPAP